MQYFHLSILSHHAILSSHHIILLPLCSKTLRYILPSLFQPIMIHFHLSIYAIFSSLYTNQFFLPCRYFSTASRRHIVTLPLQVFISYFHLLIQSLYISFYSIVIILNYLTSEMKLFQH